MGNQKKGNQKAPQKNKLDFKTCRKNTVRSLNQVEYFLNNFKQFTKYVKIYKIFK